MKEKLYSEVDNYLHLCNVFHQVIVPKLDICKASGVAVEYVTTRTPTLPRPPWLKCICHNNFEIDDHNYVHGTRRRWICGLHGIPQCSSGVKSRVLNFGGTIIVSKDYIFKNLLTTLHFLLNTPHTPHPHQTTIRFVR